MYTVPMTPEEMDGYRAMTDRLAQLTAFVESFARPREANGPPETDGLSPTTAKAKDLAIFAAFEAITRIAANC